jgi:hypothetical protein
MYHVVLRHSLFAIRFRLLLYAFASPLFSSSCEPRPKARFWTLDILWRTADSVGYCFPRVAVK